MPNPPVAVIVGPISVALTGTFTAGSTGQVSWSGTAPGGQLGFQVTSAKTQGLTIPVTFVSASGLANLYMGQSLGSLSGLDPNSHIKESLIEEIVSVRNGIKKTVDDAIAAYPADKDKCPSTIDQIGTIAVIPQEVIKTK
jgi:hypothetical protein